MIGIELALSLLELVEEQMHNPLLAALAAAVMTPGSYQDLDLLDARVASMLGGGRTAVPIDKRIKLAACPDEPEISPAQGGALAVRCAALGWRIRVSLAGASNPGVPAQILIHKGDSIELVADGAGYSASFAATALDDGQEGGVIRVKIPTSISPISATVSRPGVASISD